MHPDFRALTPVVVKSDAALGNGEAENPINCAIASVLLMALFSVFFFLFNMFLFTHVYVSN